MTAWLRAKLKSEGAGRAAMSTSELDRERDRDRERDKMDMGPMLAQDISFPVMLDDEALWEGLDEWLRSEGMGDLGGYGEDFGSIP